MLEQVDSMASNNLGFQNSWGQADWDKFMQNVWMSLLHMSCFGQVTKDSSRPESIM